MVGRALANIASSGPAMAGIFGAYVTIKATLATLEDAAEERRVGHAIVAATDGYVAGFMAGVGWSMQGGDPAWYADGQSKGSAAKDALVAKAKVDPALQKYDIGPDEVLLQIRSKRETFHSELYATVKPRIASAYLKTWRENLSWATKTFTNEVEGGERRIRTRAGMPDTGALPDPAAPPPRNDRRAAGSAIAGRRDELNRKDPERTRRLRLVLPCSRLIRKGIYLYEREEDEGLAPCACCWAVPACPGVERVRR